MTRPPLDPARGAEVAKRLRELGVKGILITAAERGYITEVKCGMPNCRCPEELGGASHFESLTKYSDWNPTHEHFPTPKRDGGQRTVENSVLAHRLCKQNRLFGNLWAATREGSRENKKSSRGGRGELTRRGQPTPSTSGLAPTYGLSLSARGISRRSAAAPTATCRASRRSRQRRLGLVSRSE
jgi:hypothetical protein